MMSRFHSYIRSAQQLIAGYDGSLPFAHFAKAFFAKEKKYGSTDRRQISALCYHYFRVAKALPELPDEERFVAATFLCETKPGKLLENLKPEWNEQTGLPLPDKLERLGTAFDRERLFPLQPYLSSRINSAAFSGSFLTQPDLFLRVRPSNEQKVPAQLQTAGIPFQPVGPNCLALRNGSKVEEALQLNTEAVVQDYSSQQTGTILQAKVLSQLSDVRCWDCCAASGGKSLMLHDLRPDASLTVSDIRPSILHNLEQRFRQAGIRQYQSFVGDMAAPNLPLAVRQTFNLIIADVPCSGSGTWARTPEQLSFFKAEQLEAYTRRQEAIGHHIQPALSAGGYLVYITCSVFAAENEAIVEKLLQKHPLTLISMDYLEGYALKADTLFMAILQKKD